MRHFSKRMTAAGAAAGVIVLGSAALVGLNAVSSDSATTQASCDPSPSISNGTDGSHITVACTVPQTTVTVTSGSNATPTDSGSVTPSPSDSVSVTPSDTPTQTSTPTQPAVRAVLGASLGMNLPQPQTLPAVRYYRAPTWQGSELQAEYNKGTRVFVVSTKDATPDSMVALDRAAPKDATFYETAWHEPDDNIADGSLTIATYVNRLNAMCKAVASFPNVLCGPIHNGFVGAATWKKDEAGIDWSQVKYWGEDRYSPNGESASQQYDEGRDYAKALGLPFVIAETGTSPSNVARQKQFALSAHNYALDPANGVAVLAWWQQTGYNFANADNQSAFFTGN